MGIIRGGLLIFVSVLLFLDIFLGSAFLVVSLSLEYKNVQREIGSIAGNLTDDKFNLIEENFNLTEEMNNNLGPMREKCQNQTEYSFAGGGYTFVISCSTLEKLNENPRAFIDATVENFVEQVYYKDYDCNFWNCFKKTRLPLFLISEKAKDYWQEKFYYSVLVFLALVVLIFLLAEQKQNTFLIVGSVSVVSSLILIKLENVAESIAGKSYFAFVRVFFSEVPTVFWAVFIFGLVLIIAGISLKFLHRDILKKKFSKKDVKEVVKSEMQKEKNKGEKKKKYVAR